MSRPRPINLGFHILPSKFVSDTPFLGCHRWCLNFGWLMIQGVVKSPLNFSQISFSDKQEKVRPRQIVKAKYENLNLKEEVCSWVSWLTPNATPWTLPPWTPRVARVIHDQAWDLWVWGWCFFPSKVAFLSYLLTKSAEIWYTFNLT